MPTAPHRGPGTGAIAALARPRPTARGPGRIARTTSPGGSSGAPPRGHHPRPRADVARRCRAVAILPRASSAGLAVTARGGPDPRAGHSWRRSRRRSTSRASSHRGGRAWRRRGPRPARRSRAAQRTSRPASRPRSARRGVAGAYRSGMPGSPRGTMPRRALVADAAAASSDAWGAALARLARGLGGRRPGRSSRTVAGRGGDRLPTPGSTRAGGMGACARSRSPGRSTDARDRAGSHGRGCAGADHGRAAGARARAAGARRGCAATDTSDLATAARRRWPMPAWLRPPGRGPIDGQGAERPGTPRMRPDREPRPWSRHPLPRSAGARHRWPAGRPRELPATGPVAAPPAAVRARRGRSTTRSSRRPSGQRPSPRSAPGTCMRRSRRCAGCSSRAWHGAASSSSSEMAPGYRFAVAPGSRVDVLEFDRAVDGAPARHAIGDRVGAEEAYRDALALYRGDLLADEGPATWLEEPRDRRRQQAVEAAAAARRRLLRAGRARRCGPRLHAGPAHRPLPRPVVAAAHRHPGARRRSGAARRARQGYDRVLVELGVSADALTSRGPCWTRSAYSDRLEHQLPDGHGLVVRARCSA